jgi:hypothetical protein
MNAVGPNNANRALLARARVNAERLVFPALVAIYTRRGGSDGATFQSGTGFLVNLGGRPVLVTARHALHGRCFDEDPWTKHIVFDGRLRGLFELRADKIFYHLNDDLAALYADEIGLAGSLPANCLLPMQVTCPAVSIYGFLGRDFRRQLPIGSLRPQPYLYTNLRAAVRSGCIGILYPTKNKNIDPRTGKIVQAPRPEGLSGGPMLDTVRLSFGLVGIVGVFTEQKYGRGLGEGAPKVIALLGQLGSNEET